MNGKVYGALYYNLCYKIIVLSVESKLSQVFRALKNKPLKAGKYINLIYSTKIQIWLMYFQSIPREDNAELEIYTFSFQTHFYKELACDNG